MEYYDEHIKAFVRYLWRDSGYDSETFEDELEFLMETHRKLGYWGCINW